MTPNQNTGGMSSPPAWVLQVLQDIREEMTGQHQRMRTDMNDAFERLGDRVEKKFDESRKEQADLRSRLDRIEAKQEAEKNAAGIIATLVSLAIGALGLLLSFKRHG